MPKDKKKEEVTELDQVDRNIASFNQITGLCELF